MHNLRIIVAALLALHCGVSGDRPAPCEKGALGIEARSRRGGGAEIREVVPGGPADAAGLREGDVLVQIGDQRIAFLCEADALAVGRECAPVRVVVERDGATIEKTITPGEYSRPDDSPDALAARGYALMEAKSPDAVSVLQQGCNGGSGAACAHLAYAYAEALLMPRDEIRAMELYTRACSLGDEKGCYSMGVFHDVGRGTSVNHTRAASAYEDACNDGVSMACTDLGFLYERGRGVIADQRRASELFRRGCEGSPCDAPNLRGCVNLGDAYRDGIGVAQDYARAAEIFRTTCANASRTEESARRRACVLFAALQFSGLGVPADEAAAFRASKEGCDEGDAYGCFNVGSIHEHRQNYILASAFYDRSCEGGDAEGCYELGMLYQDAQGVPFDPDRATTLFRRACTAGYTPACDR